MLNWYLESGKDSDVVVSSRIRLYRNISEFPFENKCTKFQKSQIIEKVEEALRKNKYGLKVFKLKDMDELTLKSLAEKHLISNNFLKGDISYKAIAINPAENICIMINGENHLEIQGFFSGNNLNKLLEQVVEIDETLGRKLKYAYNNKYGFLTACPVDAGTALKASTIVFVPSLKVTNSLSKLFNVVNNFGINITSEYGKGEKIAGNFYEISNKQNLGISEKEIVKNINLISEKITEQERKIRKYLIKDELNFEDEIFRAYGILQNCKRIDIEEAKDLISLLKMGVDLGIVDNVTDFKINKLFTFTKPANLQKILKQNLEADEENVARAEIIKQILNEQI